jgi:anti-sigma factor RsiW
MNDLVDRTMSPDARTRVEAHLAGCAECRSHVAALRALARRADEAPESIMPPDESWQFVRERILGVQADATGRTGNGAPGVVGQISGIDARNGPRRRALTTPWLVAAALVLVAGSSAVTALVLRGAGTPAGATGAALTIVRPASLPADIQTSERRYLETAVALRAALDEERSRLAPETVAIVERSLTVIEGAIGEARDALVRDPANSELRALWSRNHQQKLDLLRRAAALVQTT